MNQPVDIKPGRYWHALEDGRIQCDVCPRYCKLHEDQRGRPGAAKRSDRTYDLRALIGLLHRPNREEAAQSLPSGHASPVLRHSWVQPDLQICPELGYLQSAGF